MADGGEPLLVCYESQQPTEPGDLGIALGAGPLRSLVCAKGGGGDDDHAGIVLVVGLAPAIHPPSLPRGGPSARHTTKSTARVRVCVWACGVSIIPSTPRFGVAKPTWREEHVQCTEREREREREKPLKKS